MFLVFVCLFVCLFLFFFFCFGCCQYMNLSFLLDFVFNLSFFMITLEKVPGATTIQRYYSPSTSCNVNKLLVSKTAENFVSIPIHSNLQQNNDLQSFHAFHAA